MLRLLPLIAVGVFLAACNQEEPKATAPKVDLQVAWSSTRK